MKYYKNGFYDDEIHAVIPGNAVAISETLYQDLLTKQSQGATISTLDDGTPEAVFPPPLTIADQQAIAVAILWKNYKNYQHKYVDAEDLTLAVVCASAGSIKGQSIQQWVMDLWSEYYTKKDNIEATENDSQLALITLSCEFRIPTYTIRELNAEAQGGV